jgi:hypothetical protein
VATVTLAFTTACQGAGQVSGLRDDVRHVTQKTVTATRPHMVQQCKTGNTRVKHLRGKRTWYSTEPTTACKTVKRGKERYSKVVRQARWCVELDNVGGNKSKDDVWYQVDSATFYKALTLKEGAKIKFWPLSTGC